MKVAITGATGFVGSHLATRLSSEGHEVVRVARRAPEDDREVAIASLAEVDELAEAFAGCKAVA
ncbi:MAG TPA: NAD-dependent epimerase/dehydratase family protein, partial [Pyrinomonadaceae bacterium]|nr:NAD-dependent epimerase/dehydratase family protein [Pyrinomonadaceae bacterium]